jgi:hypothetical protein
MNSPLDRAKLLSAEMQLQRAWLDLNLREWRAAANRGPWRGLRQLGLGKMGLSLLRHRSLWLAVIGVLIKLYRRR